MSYVNEVNEISIKIHEQEAKMGSDGVALRELNSDIKKSRKFIETTRN